MNKLSIGQFAKINNISIQALRLYDKMDILKPIITNQQTGYRYYDVKQCGQLDLIQYMKGTGMSLKEIKAVFEHQDYEQLNQILHLHLHDIEQQIQNLKLQKKAVKRMIDSYHRYLKSPDDGTITLEYIEERTIYSADTKINFYDYGLEEYESLLKELKANMAKQGICDIYYYNAGTTISKEDFLNQNCISNKIFVFVDRDCISSQLQLLPYGMYACMYCDDFDKEKAYIKKLYQYIKSQNWIITGDYICEVLTELPMQKTSKREMFLRLQIPVSFVKK